MGTQTPENAQLIKDIFAGLAPILSNIALTPDKLKEALKPYIDPQVLARELREREANRKQFAEDRKITAARQQQCPHKDGNEKWSLCLTHNYPDHQVRATCPLCGIWIEPAHWVIPGPQFDGGNGMGEPYVVPEDPLYHVVRYIAAKS